FYNLMNLIISREKGRFYVPYYLEFVLHPYIKKIYFDNQTEITRVLFHTIEEALVERRVKRFIDLSEIEEDKRLIHLVKEKTFKVAPEITVEAIIAHLKSIHENTIKKMLSCKNVGDFAIRLRALIEYIYQKSTARLHPFFYPYSDSFITQLDLISRSLIREIKFEEIGTYFRLIKKILTTTYVPFLGTPLRGIQILGLLETRNLKFDRVFFLDLNEGIIPEVKKEETLLPFKVRKMLGLPTYFDREKLMGYYFDILIQGAQEAHLFYVENLEKERSRFIEKLIWQKQKEEKVIDDKTYIKKIQYQVTLQAKKPFPMDKSEEIVRFLKNFSFSASSLDTYLNCPLKFYYKYVLGLTEKEVVSEELEKEEIGLLVHQILFDYFREKIGKHLSQKDLNLQELEKTIRYRFEEQYGKEVVGEIYLLKKQIEKHLKDFITHYQIPKIKNNPLRIIALEQELEVIKDCFRLTARLDRIEKRGDRIAIIDYKTSASREYFSINFNKLDIKNPESWNHAIGTLQLPFYNLVYSITTGVSRAEIDCFFLLLGKNFIDQDIELPLFEDEDRNGLEEKLACLQHIIFALLKEIIDPYQPFIPTPNPKNQCRLCIYANICGNR
ncbi:MAG: PD-(D/E)XK nuclease family protein, partial [Desulfobacterota bacterium]|nr:PD-(D/E)XK nuclease family protein [Thermodesulfobacteriota bacterium]